MPEDQKTGGCACGQVKYRLCDAPLIVHACHCRMCQRLSGSTNAVNALFEKDNVTLESGDVTEKLDPTPSGRGQIITRCAACQVAVWSEYLILSEKCGLPVLFVRAGTLDQPEMCPPDVHIFCETVQPHYQINPKRPKHRRFHDIAQVWSPGSLARLERAQPETGHV